MPMLVIVFVIVLILINIKLWLTLEMLLKNFLLKKVDNDKDDAGGETYRGISRKYNPTWQGWNMIDQYKKHYTVGSKEFKSKLDNDIQLQKLVWSKYKIGYWDVFELDDFNSQRVAEQLFDTNVNCGQTATIKMAQRVLGLKETGRWTLDLLNKLIEIKD